MDKRIIKGIFLFIAVLVAIFSIYLYGYYASHPQFFFAVEGGDSMNKFEMYNGFNKSEIPVLECDNITQFQEYNYTDVYATRIFWKECYMYDLPEDVPYLKKAKKFVYYSVKYQGFIFLLYVLIYYLDIKYVKKKNYIKDVINRINTEGDM